VVEYEADIRALPDKAGGLRELAGQDAKVEAETEFMQEPDILGKPRLPGEPVGLRVEDAADTPDPWEPGQPLQVGAEPLSLGASAGDDAGDRRMPVRKLLVDILPV